MQRAQRDTHRHTHGHTHRHTQTHRHTERHTHRHTSTHRHTDTHGHTHTDRHTDTQTQRETAQRPRMQETVEPHSDRGWKTSILRSEPSRTELGNELKDSAPYTAHGTNLERWRPALLVLPLRFMAGFIAGFANAARCAA